MPTSKMFSTSLAGIGVLLVSLLCVPSFANQYDAGRWMVIYALAFLSTFLVIKDPRPPRLSPVLLICLAALLFLYAMGCFKNPGAYLTHLTDLFAGIALSFGAYHLFQRDRVWGVVLSCLDAALLGVLIYGLCERLGCEPFPSLLRDEYSSSFFGVRNSCAEFVGLAALLQLRFRGYRRYLLLIPSLVYLISLDNRAAWLAILFGLLPYFKGSFSRHRLKYSLIAMLLLSIIVGVTLVSRKKPFSPRVSIWRNTIEMVKEHPGLGIGPGNFEFEYFKYRGRKAWDVDTNEGEVLRSPHNGYLELAAENGLPALFIFILAFFLFTRRLGSCGASGTLILSGLFYLAGDALVAFPMEMPFPFFMACLLVGRGLAVGYVYPTERSREYLGYAVVVALVLLYGGFFVSLGEIEINAMGRFLPLACKVVPDNWRTCMRESEIRLGLKQYRRVIRLLKKQLTYQPMNFVAMRYLANTLYEVGDISEACFYLNKYDALFKNSSSLHDVFVEKCR